MGLEELLKTAGASLAGTFLGFLSALTVFRGRLAIIERNHAVLEVQIQTAMDHQEQLLELRIKDLRRDINNVAAIARKVGRHEELDAGLLPADVRSP